MDTMSMKVHLQPQHFLESSASDHGNSNLKKEHLNYKLVETKNVFLG